MGASQSVKECIIRDCESQQAADQDLVVLTINLQYFASFPKDLEKANEKLRAILIANPSVDIVCVQEGLAGRNVITGSSGFTLEVCSAERGIAQSVYDMVYGDKPTLDACDASSHRDMLCNQIYLNPESKWAVLDKGAIKISSDLELAGGGGRIQGRLAIRSMVWVKLGIGRHAGWHRGGPCVYVMCTHLTGGRFEDQYFMQSLADERSSQIDQIVNWYNEHSVPESDSGIIVGDFNATSVYAESAAMAGYFKAVVWTSKGVQQDAIWYRTCEVNASNVEANVHAQFKDYMISPFTAIDSAGWTFAYDRQHVGYTSGFGHLIDHMAMSRPLLVKDASVFYLTNQKFGNQKPDTDICLSDHNAVKTVFKITSPQIHTGPTVFYTAYDFLNKLKDFKALVHISGFGSKQQFADPEDVVRRVAQPLFHGVDSLDTHFGKGRWVACFGGDTCDEQNPDVAFLVRQLQLTYGMHLFAIQADDVQKLYGGVDKHVNAVYYYPTEYTSEGEIAWGGFREDGSTLVGTTRILLEVNPHSGLPLFWLCAGGGDIAVGEMKAAFDKGIAILSVPAQARYPSNKDLPYGPVSPFWERLTGYDEVGAGDCAWRRKKILPTEA